MTTRFSLLAAALAAGTMAALPALAQTTPPATGTPPAASTQNGMKADRAAGETTKGKGHHSRSHASRRHKRDSSATGKQE